MRYENITADISATRVATITLSRPEKRNALSIALREEISDVLAAWHDDDRVGAIIFAGAGKGFCAGFDLGEFMAPTLARRVFESSAKYHRDLYYFPKPVIAAIHGNALGGGFDLATLCDIRIASPTARFAHPEIKFGGPPLFTPLRNIVGEGHARSLCLAGRSIDAAEAYRIGLVSEIVEEGRLIGRAREIAGSILEAPAHTLAVTKKYMTLACGSSFEESFTREHDDAFIEALKKGVGPSP